VTSDFYAIEGMLEEYGSWGETVASGTEVGAFKAGIGTFKLHFDGYWGIGDCFSFFYVNSDGDLEPY